MVKYKIDENLLIVQKSVGGKVSINNRIIIKALDTSYVPYGFPSSILVEADSNYLIDSIWLNGSLYSSIQNYSNNRIIFINLNNIIEKNYIKILFRRVNPPPKPVIDSLISGSRSVLVAFSSPIATVGSEPLYYRVTCYPTNTSIITTTSPGLINGLPLNVPLRFTVRAINNGGATLSDTSRVIILRDSVYFINSETINFGGTISEPVSAILGSMKTVTFSAFNDYLIDTVVVDGIGIVGNRGKTTGSYTFNSISSNHSVFVGFRRITYRVTGLTNQGGALLINGRYISLFGSSVVNSGDSISVTLLPNYGYALDTVFINNINIPISQLLTNNQGYKYVRLNSIRSNQTVRVLFKAENYRITIGANTNLGYINPAGQVLVIKNQNLTVNFVAYFGNAIDSVFVNGRLISWNRTGQDLNYGSYTFTNVSGDSSIKVIFKQQYYNVRISSNTAAGGIVAPRGKIILQRGDSLRVYVFAASRYIIDSIIVNGKALNLARNLKTYEYLFTNITGDSSLEVKFKQLYYNISSSFVGMGDMSPLGDVRVLNNTSFRFGFYPETGYHVSKLVINEKDTIKYAANSNVQSYVFYQIQANQKLEVVFDLINVAGSVKTPINFAGEPKRFTIYSSSNEAGVVPVQGRTEYDSGTRAVLHFVIPGGYRLDSVILDGIQQPLIDSLVIDGLAADHTVRVVVNPNGKYVISSLVNQGGSIVQSGSDLLTAGTNKTITVAIDANYELQSVKVDGVLLNSTNYQLSNNSLLYTFNNIQANHSFEVTLTQKLYNITIKANAGGVLSQTGTQLVANNNNLGIEYYANAGYKVSSIKVDGQALFNLNSSKSYTFANITSNHSFEVEFEAVQANLITQVIVNNKVLSIDTTLAVTGTGNTISIDAMNSYRLVSVDLNGTSLPLTSVNLQNGKYYYVIDNVSSDNIISFNFINNVSISTSANNGTITPSFLLNYGDTVKVTYRGNKGYIVSRVYKNGQDITESTTMSADSTFGSLWYIASSNDSIRVVFVQKYFGVDFIQISVTQPACNTVGAVGNLTINFKRSGIYNVYRLDMVSKQEQSFFTPITTDYTINNLLPSVYRLVISDTNYPQLTRVFVVKVTLPAAITTYSNVIPNQQLLALDIKSGNVGYANLNGIIYQNLSGQNQLPLKNGVNTLILKNSETCEDSVVQTIVYSEGISLYPNPAQSYTNLNIGGSDVEVTIELLMDNGQVVKQELRHIDANRNIRLNLDGLNAGVYIIKVKGKQANGTLKLIKN